MTAKAERDIQNQVLLQCGVGDTTLFRQNVGQGWTGDAHRYTQRGTVTVNPGDVVIRSARPLHAGLCTGSPDIVGWRRVLVTPEMVGQTVAVFVGLEVKAPKGRATDAQVQFLTILRDSGGIAAIVRSPEDADRALHGAD